MKTVLDTFHFNQDSAPEKYSGDEVSDSQVEEHPVSFLTPKFCIREDKVTEEEVGENDEYRADNHKGGPCFRIGEPWPLTGIRLCLPCPEVYSAG